jgi:hypothetical protein
MVQFVLLTSNKQVKKKFGHQAEVFFVILTAIQFHLLFYSSRPLPNIFALALGKHVAHCRNKSEICFSSFWQQRKSNLEFAKKKSDSSIVYVMQSIWHTLYGLMEATFVHYKPWYALP